MGYVFPFSSPITSPNENTSKQPELLWRRGVLVITTEKLHFTKPVLRFCPGSNLALGVLDGKCAMVRTYDNGPGWK